MVSSCSNSGCWSRISTNERSSWSRSIDRCVASAPRLAISPVPLLLLVVSGLLLYCGVAFPPRAGSYGLVWESLFFAGFLPYFFPSRIISNVHMTSETRTVSSLSKSILDSLPRSGILDVRPIIPISRSQRNLHHLV